ncbi:MAG: hypothetical protein KKC77_19240, partial [Proteobacteria bacterium]|nr:hypothetical protein [Pseudomonadota bacterium]
MAKDKIEIEVLAKGVAKAQKDIEKLTGSLKKNKKENDDLLKSFKKNWLKIAAVVGTVAVAFKKVFDISQQAAKFNQSMTAARQQFGVDADKMIKKLKEVSDGTIANTDLISAANRAMALNVTKDIDKMAQLMEVARVRGRAMGLDTTQAFNDLVTGIGRGSPLILDNLGIITKGWADEAKGAGKAMDAQFILNKVLKDGADILRKTGALVLTDAEQFDTFGVVVKNFTLELGQKLLPSLQKSNEILSDLFNNTSDQDKALRSLKKSQSIYLENQKSVNQLTKEGKQDTLLYRVALSKLNASVFQRKADLAALKKAESALNVELQKAPGTLKQLNIEQKKNVANLGTMDIMLQRVINGEKTSADTKALRIEKIKAGNVFMKDEEAALRLVGKAQIKINETQKEINKVKDIGNEIDRISAERKAILVAILEDETKATGDTTKATGDTTKAVELSEKEKVDIRKQAYEASKELMNDFFSAAADMRERDLQATLDSLETERQARLTAAGTATAELAKMDEEDRANRIIGLENERDIAIAAGDTELAKEKQREIDRIALLDKQKKEEAAINEEFDKKIADAKTAAAIKDREAKVLASITNTALAVVSTLAGTFGGPIAKKIAAGIIGTLGMAQTAIIRSTPIPKFAQGTNYSPGGSALVGERGP